MALKIKDSDEITQKVENKHSFKPYEEENQIRPLKLFVVVIPFGQINAIQKIFNEYETSLTLSMNGEGVRFNSQFEMYNSTKKSVMFAIVREDKADVLKSKLEERFNVSKASSGIAFVVSLTSVAGVTIYKFLSNTRKVVKESKYAKRSFKD